uniref:UDP-3-O-acyl-N-acetylglucosamine deacetylase n=1 Tax=candidate division WOR-3 bacterium TaxID=2052148 RepID=A0A7V3UZH4_UNCW3
MTIDKKITITGWTRTGDYVKLRIHPAPAGTGIIINSIPALIQYARAQNHTTTLYRQKTTIHLVEHLLAACYALRITDLFVQLTPTHKLTFELPFCDGSSLLFTRRLLAATRNSNLTNSTTHKPITSLKSPVAIRTAHRLILAIPAPCLKINCLINYRHTGEQFYSAKITPARFLKQLAPARTFGKLKNSRTHQLLRLPFRLKKFGNYLFPARPRFTFEPCRHKLLDLLGDLALLGKPLHAEIFAYNPSHQLNLKFVQELKRRTDDQTN